MSHAILTLVLAILMLFFGIQLSIWFTVGVMFVVSDPRSQKMNLAKRVSSFLMFTFIALVGYTMAVGALFLIGQTLWHGWKSWHG